MNALTDHRRPRVQRPAFSCHSRALWRPPGGGAASPSCGSEGADMERMMRARGARMGAWTAGIAALALDTAIVWQAWPVAAPEAPRAALSTALAGAVATLGAEETARRLASLERAASRLAPEG